jgi:hypothetical protein
MLSVNYVTVPTYVEETKADENEETVNDKVLAIKNYDDPDEYEVNNKKENSKTVSYKRRKLLSHELCTHITFFQPCAIVVLSNIQNPSMQSLLRKYRYDANG